MSDAPPIKLDDLMANLTAAMSAPAPNTEPPPWTGSTATNLTVAADPNAVSRPQTQPVEPAQGANPVGQQQGFQQIVNPNPAQPQAPKPQGPPTPRPNILDLLQTFHPEQKPPQIGAFGALGPNRSGSRLDHLEQFLGNFLTAFSSGMANAHGPGAFGKGFGAAVQAPYQRAVQQYQLGQQQQMQQAQMQNLQSEAALRQAQAQPVNVPGISGPIPAGSVPTIYRGFPAAQVSGQAGIQKQQIATQGQLNVEQLKLMAAMGQISKIVPVQGQNGLTMRALNKYGQPIGDIDGAVPPASYLPKTSSTVDFKQLDDGSIVAIPKSTTTTPRLPGAIGKGPGAVGGGTPRALVNAQGQPLIGKGALTGTTRTMVETAPKVMDLVNRMRGQIQQLQQTGQLGPGGTRWADFWSGKVGSANPEFRAFKTNADLLSTLLMRMHVGARGGEKIMEHFDKMIGAGHQSAENMLATLDQISLYTNDVQGGGQLPANFGTANKPQAQSPKAKNKVLDPLGIR